VIYVKAKSDNFRDLQDRHIPFKELQGFILAGRLKKLGK
jgi:hypothetical protein